MNSESIPIHHHSRSNSLKNREERNRISRSRSSFMKKRESIERNEEVRFNRSRERKFERDFRPMRKRSTSDSKKYQRYMKKNSRENSAENKGIFFM